MELNNFYNTTIKKYVDEQDTKYDTSVKDVSDRLDGVSKRVSNLVEWQTTMTSTNVNEVIDTYKEIENFLTEISDATTL